MPRADAFVTLICLAIAVLASCMALVQAARLAAEIGHLLGG